jgi:hypothetical protein
MLRQRGAGVASVHPGPSATDSLLVSGEGQPVTWRRSLLGALLLLAVFALARGPLIAVSHAQPVSNDDAIPLLIGRALLHGEISTTLWNQPYNATLDSTLLAPLLAALPHHTAFRAYEMLCALLLAGLVFGLARRAGGEAAGLLAGSLAAFGSPYMALMACTGPPPNFLMPLVVGLPVALAYAYRDRPSPAWAPLLGGLVAGAAVWNSSLAIPALLGAALGFAGAGLRPRPRSALLALLGFLSGAWPLLAARLIGASGASTVTAVRPSWLWLDGGRDLLRALAGLWGVQVPLVIDGPERAALPLALAALLAVTLLVAVLAGASARPAWPLVGWAALLLAGFAASRRTNGDEVRYLYGSTAPLLALAGLGLARLRPWRRAVALAVVLSAWAAGHRVLVDTWRDPAHGIKVWQVPRLEPVIETLQRASVESAYASLQFAGRLTLETQGQVIASQAWNERVPGDPLRFRDEVDLDPRAVWVLHPGLSRGLPRAGLFRQLLGEMGGGFREDLPGDFVVFRGFRPPYDESRPVPTRALSVRTAAGQSLPASVLDRDATTAWVASQGLAPGAGLEVSLDSPRRLSALLLGVDLRDSPLAVPWIAEVDGETVARGPCRHVLQWINGAPRAGKQALLVVPLGERTGGAVRLLFQGAGPVLRISEVFVYGPDEVEQAPLGAESARAALKAARAGRWDDAVAGYTEAARLEPGRASFHACLERARHRAGLRRRIDVEGLDDGGEAMVLAGR